jgi:RNA polymerase sigma factor (TIGR02999 family)
MDPDRNAATAALFAARNGDALAASRLLELLYAELRGRAGALLQSERPDHTLQPTALVHEAYLRLVKAESVDWAGRTHFFAVAAQTMRRILVDHARARRAQKRDGVGGRDSWTITAALSIARREEIDGEVLAGALEELASVDERAARIVELRFLGGLTEVDISSFLEVSERTVRNEWAWARSWLRQRLAEA